ncbi:MAG: hypothetical protein HRT52_19850 [Colwellia sp.]|nr:hypothetical protein [Colwellia sp.]
MKIIPSQNVQLETSQPNQTSKAKINSTSINESVITPASTQASVKVNTEVAKASGTLQPDVVNIGNNKASNALTYDVKTMSRQANTSYTGASGDTPPNPAAYTGSGSYTNDAGNTPTVSYTGAGGHTGPKPV